MEPTVGSVACVLQGAAPRRERLEARQVALHVRLVVAHEARAGHRAPHDGLERVRQAALLALLLLRARRIHVQPHACTRQAPC